ncbi:lipopolysaccharide 1,3-galactosyltransferase [Citrobacter koseri]|uniref:Lipopolysaccharide 1,3-galactosyltransferase n=1 Tax=Citrobacter koseri TaxID=545 RepID=A0A2X2YQC5_CITKO|nr:lipopolysaccharide 1,3-galactosyltransferase [Citrobacter koseri]
MTILIQGWYSLISMSGEKKNCYSKAFEVLHERQKELLYFDQDILNILFVGHVILLRRDFNCIYGVDQELKNTK